MKLKTLVSTLDALLRPDEITDYPGAVNGLQIENGGAITRIVAAVDACGQAATGRRIDFVMVRSTEFHRLAID